MFHDMGGEQDGRAACMLGTDKIFKGLLVDRIKA